MTATRDKGVGHRETPASISRIDGNDVSRTSTPNIRRTCSIANARRVHPARAAAREPRRRSARPSLTGAGAPAAPSGRRRQPAHPPGRVLQPQRDVRDSTTSRLARSKCFAGRARPCLAPAPFTASSMSSRRRSSSHARLSVRRGRSVLIRLQARELRAHGSGSSKTQSRGLHGTYGSARARRAGATSSGVDEAQVEPVGRLPTLGGGQLRLRAAGSVLNQETAGFIQELRQLSRRGSRAQQPQPRIVSRCLERASVCAFRQARCLRRAEPSRARGHLSPLTHGLHASTSCIGKPVEHNAQTSFMVSSAASKPFGALNCRAGPGGRDRHFGLAEFQTSLATDGAPPANAIRPAGFSLRLRRSTARRSFGATLSVDYAFRRSSRAAAAVRVDSTNYDYDNHTCWMATPTPRAPPALGGGACSRGPPRPLGQLRESFRPASALAWRARANQLLYVNLATGFRPPETAGSIGFSVSPARGEHG